MVTSSEQLGEANQFNITGPFVISYSTTSFAGVPLFSYKDAQLDLNFSGDEITRQDTPLGEIVTVTLEDLFPVDGPRRTFTLLVPTIRLSLGDELSFDTQGIETITSSGFGPPSPVVLQVYRSYQLQGTATLVNF
ncbi:MAG: hypothetical protein ACT4NY_32925 [Pseudonocardiales bacterium]